MSLRQCSLISNDKTDEHPMQKSSPMYTDTWLHRLYGGLLFVALDIIDNHLLDTIKTLDVGDAAGHDSWQ